MSEGKPCTVEVYDGLVPQPEGEEQLRDVTRKRVKCEASNNDEDGVEPPLSRQRLNFPVKEESMEIEHQAFRSSLVSDGGKLKEEPDAVRESYGRADCGLASEDPDDTVDIKEEPLQETSNNLQKIDAAKVLQLRRTGQLYVESLNDVVQANVLIPEHHSLVKKLFIKLPKNLPCGKKPEIKKLFNLLHKHYIGPLWVDLRHSFVNYISCDTLFATLQGSRVALTRVVGCLASVEGTRAVAAQAARRCSVCVSLPDPLDNAHLSLLRGKLEELEVYVSSVRPVLPPPPPRPHPSAARPERFPPPRPLPGGVGRLSLQVCGVTRHTVERAYYIMVALAPIRGKRFHRLRLEAQGKLSAMLAHDPLSLAAAEGVRTRRLKNELWGLETLWDDDEHLRISGGSLFNFLIWKGEFDD